MADYLALWQQIVSTAILGLNRQGFATADLPDSLRAAISVQAAGSPEAEFLRVISIMAPMISAGRGLPTSNQPVDGCPQETTARMCDSAAQTLINVLLPEHPELLPEWLTMAKKQKRRIPEEYLPAFLTWLDANREFIEDALPVMGEHGIWLVKQIDVWKNLVPAFEALFSSPDVINVRWETGNKTARHILITFLRNKNPEAARQMIASSFASEEASFRQQLVYVLQSGLSPADEAFLETALADRTQPVKNAAGNLLIQLPDSQYIQRMKTRAALHLGLIKPADKRGKVGLEVNLPESFDQWMKQHGFEKKVPDWIKVGEKAWWLFQIISRVPPAYWCECWQMDAQPVMALVKNSDWKTLLTDALREAAITFNDINWKAVLLSDTALKAQQFNSISPEKRDAFFTALVQKKPADAIAILFNYQQPWSKNMTIQMVLNLEAYLHTLGKNASGSYYINRIKSQLVYMDRSVGDVVQKILINGKQAGSPMQAVGEYILAALSLRTRMMEELTDDECFT